MKTIRLISKFVLTILIAFVIVPVSCAEAKLVVAPPPPPLPPANIYPPTNTIKKVSGLQKNAGVAKNDAGVTSSAATQNDAQPLVIGPPPPVNILPIGTYSNVLAYAVAHVNIITLGVFVWNTNNASWKAYYGQVWYASATNYVTSKVQMDQQIIAAQITNVISQIITNTNPTIDKSKGVLIYATCGFQTNNATSYQNLDAYEVIPLPKNPNGSYGMPDLSSFSTTLADYVSFYVPSLQWARLEIGYKGDLNPFEVDDGLYDPLSNPIDSGGFLEMPTSYITDSSLASGNFWMKITLFSGNTFLLANGDGNQIPETPMVLGMSKNGTNAYVTVNGGDSGRGFVLQWSSNLISWTNSPAYFFSPLPESEAIPPQFYWPLSSANKMFFRTVVTNTVPTY
jgi:hypothetical protein